MEKELLVYHTIYGGANVGEDIDYSVKYGRPDGGETDRRSILLQSFTPKRCGLQSCGNKGKGKLARGRARQKG